MLLMSIVCLSSFCATEALIVPPQALPVQFAGWEIIVGPGSVVLRGEPARKLSPAVKFTVAPPEKIPVRGEKFDVLPEYNEKTSAGWARGARPACIITQECTATGALIPESLVLRPAADEKAAPFVLDKDYKVDPLWGTFGRMQGGAITETTAVLVDYDYYPERLDSIAIDAAGRARLVPGTPGVGSILPPALAPGEKAVVSIFVKGGTTKLDNESVFPIQTPTPRITYKDAPAEKLLPKTLAKLRAGEKVVIVAFGDSVTCGGGVDGKTELFYQNHFAAELQKRFPKAQVEMRTAGWGGAGSKQYMEAPKGGEHDYIRDLIDPHPDLVTIEFVNDAYLDEAGVAPHYGKILADLRGAGAEVVFITPHLVRPDWLKSDTLKVDADPRPYVSGLINFALRENVAVADASREWCTLWRQGLPYVTLLANSINHPDERGHVIFVNALMGLFPEK